MQHLSILNKYVIQKVAVFNPYLSKATRMLQLNFAENYNGKLFCDHFPDLRPHDPEVFFVGNLFKINVSGDDFGTAKICALKSIQFKKLNDLFSYLNVGRAAHAQAYFFNQIYSLEPGQLLDQLVFSWEVNTPTYIYRLSESYYSKIKNYAATAE